MKVCFAEPADSTKDYVMSPAQCPAFFSQKADEDNFVVRIATRYSPKTNKMASIFLSLARFVLTQSIPLNKIPFLKAI
ncbi:hypothetical protein DXU84_19730 [Rahnella sp. RcJ3]|jgi:hypothetical protein|nr:hypothetical protein [Rahnella sp. RcJ3]